MRPDVEIQRPDSFLKKKKTPIEFKINNNSSYFLILNSAFAKPFTYNVLNEMVCINQVCILFKWLIAMNTIWNLVLICVALSCILACWVSMLTECL